MPAHSRQTIRDAAVALLEAVPALDGRVRKSRVFPAGVEELPLALVYSLEEDAERPTLAPLYTRTLRLVVALQVKALDGAVDDALDDLALAVEPVMATPFLGLKGQVLDAMLERSAIDLRAEGDTATGVLVLVYAVKYRTLAATPGSFA